MQGPITSDTNVMKQQGAGLEPLTFEPEVRHAIDCAAKACSGGRVDFRAYKSRVVTVEYTVTLLKLPGHLSEKYDLTFVQVQTPTLFCSSGCTILIETC